MSRYLKTEAKSKKNLKCLQNFKCERKFLQNCFSADVAQLKHLKNIFAQFCMFWGQQHGACQYFSEYLLNIC
jgi:hypothetical protein